MELSLYLSLFTLCCCIVCTFQGSDTGGSSSGSSDKLEMNEVCGKEGFYCPHDGKCYDRSLRCTSANVCVRDANSTEEKCYESKSPGWYNYYRKKSPIRNLPVRHWFVEYRGFVYEFGSGGNQELDINDPNYKYGPGREKVVDEELMGTSSCTREEVGLFIKKWRDANPDYRLFVNNCQDFVKDLLKELRHDCSRSRRKKRQVDESLRSQCPLITSATSSHIFLSNWKLLASYGPLITSIVFAMN